MGGKELKDTKNNGNYHGLRKFTNTHKKERYFVKTSRHKPINTKSSNSFKLYDKKGVEGKLLNNQRVNHLDEILQTDESVKQGTESESDKNVLNLTLKTARNPILPPNGQWNKFMIGEQDYTKKSERKNQSDSANKQMYIWVSDKESETPQDSVERNVDTSRTNNLECEEVLTYDIDDEQNQQFNLTLENLKKLGKKPSNRDRLMSDPVESPTKPKKSFHLSDLKMAKSSWEPNLNLSTNAQ